MKILLTVGHRPHSPGAANMGSPDPDDDVYEFYFNRPIVQAVAERLYELGVDADPDEYRGRGNVARWNGASDLLVEFHCNAANGNASGTEVIHAVGSEKGMEAAGIIQRHLVAALGLRDRGIKGPWNNRGGYLLYGVRQPCVIVEPFFIDNDDDLARAKSVDLVGAYTAALAEIAERWSAR